MKLSYILFAAFAVLLLASSVTAMEAEVDMEAEGDMAVDHPRHHHERLGRNGQPCHPQCRWQCDDPSCPAQCHPVCERPKCQVHCEETPCAACKIHCDKPQCNIRCPKDVCESDDCPKCETVCAPAKCRTACTAPNAVCTPMCEETKCDWKCKKPTLCPRPKCELVCEKPACAAERHHHRRHHSKRAMAMHALHQFLNSTRPFGCCPCNAANVQASMIQAGEAVEGSETMSFLEVMHTIKHRSQEQGEQQCCACSTPQN